MIILRLIIFLRNIKSSLLIHDTTLIFSINLQKGGTTIGTAFLKVNL